MVLEAAGCIENEMCLWSEVGSDEDEIPHTKELGSTELRGVKAFEAYYAAQKLTEDESIWARSFELLQTPMPPCFRVRCPEHVPGSQDEAICRAFEEWQPVKVSWAPHAFRLVSPEAVVGANGFYDEKLALALSDAQSAGHIGRQESASMLPAIALPVSGSDKVLELCAAPGSKTLQMLDNMHRRCIESSSPAESSSHVGAAIMPNGLLHSVDLSQVRLKKLVERARRVPATSLIVSRSDARHCKGLRRSAGGQTVLYDKVFCDVPCSGDGTLRKSRQALAGWTAGMGLGFHDVQLDILKRGFELLAPGGVLAYSTCSLNPIENEAVVAAALAHFGELIEVQELPESLTSSLLEPGLETWKVPVGPQKQHKKNANAVAKREGHPEPELGGKEGGDEDCQDGLACGKLFEKWEDVDESLKVSGKLRRSMFPPEAYTTSGTASKKIKDALRRCGRLLPAKDNGGCFFVALLRRKFGCVSFRRGDRACFMEKDCEVLVRGAGTGRYVGLVRVTFPDATQCHVESSKLRRIGGEGVGEGEGSQAAPAATAAAAAGHQKDIEDDASSSHPLLQALPREIVERIASEFGIALPEEACCTFPWNQVMLVDGEDQKQGACRGLRLCSKELQSLAKPLEACYAIGRPLFYEDEVGAVWRPVPEAASFLVPHCTRGVIWATREGFWQLLCDREVALERLGHVVEENNDLLRSRSAAHPSQPGFQTEKHESMTKLPADTWLGAPLLVALSAAAAAAAASSTLPSSAAAAAANVQTSHNVPSLDFPLTITASLQNDCRVRRTGRAAIAYHYLRLLESTSK